MKKLLFTTLLSFFLFLGGLSQSYNLTFQVDMRTQSPIASSISVAGNFQTAAGYANDWTPGQVILTDANNDSIFDITVTVPSGSYEFKYLNGTTWGTDEGVPSACAINGNRGVTISADTVLPAVCFGSCSPCPILLDSALVTFQVDMTNEVVADTVSIAGDFQSLVGDPNWTPGVTIMTDPNMDGVYEFTALLEAGSYQFKYINGTAWGQDETVPASCAVNNLREVVVSGTSPIVIPLVCFSKCDTCVPPPDPINVTFQLNMSNEIVNIGGVFVSGNFMDPAWVKDSLQLADGNGDDVYRITVSMIPAEYQYKYYNGDGGDIHSETANFEAMGCGVPSGLGGWNRILDLDGHTTDTILPAYEFNSCNITPSDRQGFLSASQLTVFPNPFVESLDISLWGISGKGVITLTDLRGRVLRQTSTLGLKPSTQLTWDTAGLPSGMYLFIVKLEDGRMLSRKMVKE